VSRYKKGVSVELGEKTTEARKPISSILDGAEAHGGVKGELEAASP